MESVFRARPVDPRKLDSADKIFSELLCDPERFDDVKYQVLDELGQRSAFLRNLAEEERELLWQDQDGRTVPPDYTHYKDRPLTDADVDKTGNDL